ncbi:outer membrane receptor protein involved in Fe transport [Pedobacter sp. AK017]|uniref:TonB-dependent receptor n=1 Tax=Pedobacter sp. AK017 TaxID=2723073 RepID=UPI001618750D|nr:TonB-dependent receptor [Pedobacter sp. AK017]MBB5437429.1 outer membrane receptor protein involved in Fe transport [Pedobacter sp. AK017]
MLIFLIFTSFYAQAQQGYTLEGIVKSGSGELFTGAGVVLQGSNKSSVTDGEGKFSIRNIPAGEYRLKVKYIGYADRIQKVTITGNTSGIQLVLKARDNDLSEVSVIGRTVVQETNRQAFNVTAVDAKKLYNTTLDISGALDRVAGIRVRESGGVGSNFNLSLNGFSGNHIRYFIDGIPMDNFGSSFQINNIPINVAERIEVYKGVVPMWLGADALGGAINIVTGDRQRNFIDAAYAYGSFNTHRTVFNTVATSKSGFTVQLNAFQNYSDNDYKVTLSTINTGVKEDIKLRRFHDNYHNETVIANVGLVDKGFADKLLLGITLGKNYKEIQTGARMEAVFGALHRRGSIVMPSLKYKKTDLIKGLDVTVNANYNLGYEQNIDTMNVRYDWYGVPKNTGTSGERGRTFAKYRNNNGLATAMVNYNISDNQSVALNNVFTTFNRKTNDLLNPANNISNLLKKTYKNVLGLGYSYNVKDRWSVNLFGKYIYQNNVNGTAATGESAIEKIGYCTAVTYYFNSSLQLKGSYELTNRMPEANEIFGDLENMDGNPALKPEKSDNINLGLIYGFSLNKIHNFSITANAIYRQSDQFIYNRLNLNQTKLVADNREGVSTWGGDAEIRYSYKDWLSAGSTFTYQFLRNLQKYEPNYSAVSPLYLDQMPNIPYLYGNADISVSLKNVGNKNNNLSIGYNLLYVHAFWLYWPSLGGKSANDAKREVPQQLAHDLNFVYSMAKGRYNIGLEAKNLTNEDLFDNFSLQKPGRGFYLNLRYFFNKNN